MKADVNLDTNSYFVVSLSACSRGVAVLNTCHVQALFVTELQVFGYSCKVKVWSEVCYSCQYGVNKIADKAS